MNKNRRKVLEELIDKLEDIKGDIELCMDEEQEYYDNMPESLQNGEKGDVACQAIDALEEAVSDIESAISNLEEASL